MKSLNMFNTVKSRFLFTFHQYYYITCSCVVILLSKTYNPCKSMQHWYLNIVKYDNSIQIKHRNDVNDPSIYHWLVHLCCIYLRAKTICTNYGEIDAFRTQHKRNDEHAINEFVYVKHLCRS